ncbi:hypothetical protein RS130_04265 [Paraglaciecola aquimarina]|uniref:Uncharacterized protein n=1 Tax=Paraglaciecola aquimarina TaxID=1235557 RepID=A0ABU3STF4_9ALTE|nr:hypothetical protein [Paraglaciecola aquimarina]MDU0353247.1 hypothetical protein [Paraglaciecola aquimarina]
MDTLVPAKVAALLADLSDKIDVTVLGKSSHAPFISNPQSFATDLTKVLR